MFRISGSTVNEDPGRIIWCFTEQLGQITRLKLVVVKKRTFSQLYVIKTDWDANEGCIYMNAIDGFDLCSLTSQMRCF